MDKAELINTLYKGDKVPTDEAAKHCLYLCTPTNIRLLFKKLVVLSNLVEYDNLKNSSSAILAVDFGRLAAIYDIISWAVIQRCGSGEIARIAWGREIADFLTETPETLNSIHHDSTLQQDK